jgi:hypothetical protein
MKRQETDDLKLALRFTIPTRPVLYKVRSSSWERRKVPTTQLKLSVTGEIQPAPPFVTTASKAHGRTGLHLYRGMTELKSSCYLWVVVHQCSRLQVSPRPNSPRIVSYRAIEVASLYVGGDGCSQAFRGSNPF